MGIYGTHGSLITVVAEWKGEDEEEKENMMFEPL